MVVDQRGAEDERTDILFHALADATRRDIVRVVLEGEHSVSDLARRYPMSFAAVQKHVAVLERADLIIKHQQGRERIVRGRIDAVRAVNNLLDQLEAAWSDRQQRFGDVLAEPDEGDHP
jgi:DNA-binding transcriptional ArsR family regulator